MDTKKHPKLTPEEKKILTSFEKGEWKSLKNIETEKQAAQKAAARTISMNQKP